MKFRFIGLLASGIFVASSHGQCPAYEAYGSLSCHHNTDQIDTFADNPWGLYSWRIWENGAWQPIQNGAYYINSIHVADFSGTQDQTLVTQCALGNSIWNFQFIVRCVVAHPIDLICYTTQTFITFCDADFNCDSVVEYADYLDFVDAFTLEDPSADINFDQIVDYFDYLDFVDAYGTGCLTP